MSLHGRWLALVIAVMLVAPARAEDPLLAQVRMTDLRLAKIGFRLSVANAALCDRTEPGTGIVFHALDEYQPSLRARAVLYFDLAAPLGVEAVVPGSPADRAGVAENDAVTSVDGKTLQNGPLSVSATTKRLVATDAAIAALDPRKPLLLGLIRNGKPLQVTLQPVPACRSRFELEISPIPDASANGTMVQVSAKLLDLLASDDDVAAVVAHELAHNVLNHALRLDRQNVDGGMLDGFGRNVHYWRQTETEADILSVSLLANAGYDPHLPERFWRTYGPKLSSGIFASRSHPAWRDRAATVAKEAEIVAASPTHPYVSPLLATRDTPLSGNWQAILVHAK